MNIQLNKVEVPTSTLPEEILSANVATGASVSSPTTTSVVLEYSSLTAGEKATVDAFVTLLKNKTV